MQDKILNISTIKTGANQKTSSGKITIDYGHYLFFVISNNRIRHYLQLHLIENNLSSEGTKPIRINLQ
ncbi:MAG: hypothetical protein ABIS01_03200 [Ferruginibacter sp.]